MSSTLYFAYTAHISPERLDEIVPEAEFEFIAHLPETRLIFPVKDGDWDGGLPSVRAEPGNTVWGAVFSVPTKKLKVLNEAEHSEGRVPSESFKAVDREGRSHRVVTHIHSDDTNDDHTPSRQYMQLVVDGAQHWGLPMGWVAGLEEYVEEPLF